MSGVEVRRLSSSSITKLLTSTGTLQLGEAMASDAVIAELCYQLVRCKRNVYMLTHICLIIKHITLLDNTHYQLQQCYKNNLAPSSTAVLHTCLGDSAKSKRAM